MSAEILCEMTSYINVVFITWARKVLKLLFFVCTKRVHSSYKIVIFKELDPVLLVKVSPSNYSLFCEGVMGLHP